MVAWRSVCLLVPLTFAFVAAPCSLLAQDATPASEPKSLRELIDAAVTSIDVLADADAKDPAKPLVALRWANNARGSEDGMTLLYVFEGRPLATACLYPWAGRLVHDFESISRGNIVARRESQIVWQPKESGVKFAPIPDAPPPEATPKERLRQMKSLAEQFQSSMLGWKADSTDREELRLLPRPLYRYESKDAAIIDGAVFAFVMGTDPESLLLIEAVSKGGEPAWEFAFARRTSGELEGRHKDKIVWHADRYPPNNDPSKPHFSIGAPIPAELLPAQGEK
jgi:hypothetical protein